MVTEMIYFLWKLEFEAVNESRLPFFVGLSGKLGGKVGKSGKSPKLKNKG